MRVPVHSLPLDKQACLSGALRPVAKTSEPFFTTCLPELIYKSGLFNMRMCSPVR
jgi:hypothetical protein